VVERDAPNGTIWLSKVRRRKDKTMSGAMMSGSEMVIKALTDQGVDVVFGYPGGAVLPIYDALFAQNELQHILVRQEGGAVHGLRSARVHGPAGVHRGRPAELRCAWYGPLP